MGVGFRSDTIRWYCTTIRCFDVISGSNGAEFPFLVSQTLLCLNFCYELCLQRIENTQLPFAKRALGILCLICPLEGQKPTVSASYPAVGLILKHTAQRFKLFTLSPTNSQLGRGKYQARAAAFLHGRFQRRLSR